MKNKIRKLVLDIIVTLVLITCIGAAMSEKSSAYNIYIDELQTKKEDKNDAYEKESVIYDYAKAVNDKDVDKYISLFAQDIQKEMRAFLDIKGRSDFFLEDACNILLIEEQKDVFPDINEEYKTITRFLVVEEIDFKDTISRDVCKLKQGINNCEVVLVKEDNEWRIGRISSKNETIGTYNTLTCPSETVIYFTKNDNRAHWNAVSKNLMWDEYIKNVIPSEWIVSFFYLTDYGKTGSLASKMYAWYNTVNPKWYFSPYYACMKDNSSDQNYVYYKYNNLAINYKNYLNTSLSQISNMAIVKNDNTLFDIHYSSDSRGAEHNGWMDQDACLSYVQANYSYSYIIHYYYDQSPYTNYTDVKIVTY